MVNEPVAARPEVVRYPRTGLYAVAQPADRSLAERAVDAVLADSFPASDPPSWTPGIAETRPPSERGRVPHLVISTGTPLWFQRVVSVAGLILVVLAFPLLVAAVPLAFAWRAVLEVTKWRTT